MNIATLNPALFAKLDHHFGEPSVSKAGQSNQTEYTVDPFTSEPLQRVTAYGESYQVNCPHCGDTHRSLNVNHDYGETDPITGRRQYQLIKCFHKDCFKLLGRSKQLLETLSSMVNHNARWHAGLAPVSPQEAIAPAV